MVVDDSNTIRRSAEIFLAHSGCEVILATDGFDAMAKVIDCQPDIIFWISSCHGWMATRPVC